MAKKEAVKKEQSKLLQVLTKEYKWENLLLAILVLAGIIISVLILTDVLAIDETFPVLGYKNTGKIFAWVLLGIAVIGLLLVLYPFIGPALPELKKVSWARGAKYWKTALTVFVFIIIVTLVLFLFDYVGVQIQKVVNDWRN